MTILNMQTLRYLNLLNNTAKIRIKKCFIYNNTIIFAVPLQFVSQAIGPKGKHVRALQEKLEKKIKIIGDANGIEDVNKFIKQIVEPVSFVSIDVNENEIVIIDLNTIENRIEIFINKVNKFQILDFTEAKKFIDYWTEHGERDKKCRWEKEKSFDISKRMNRWSNNIKSNNYGQSTTESHQQAIDGIDEITKRIVPQGNG